MIMDKWIPVIFAFVLMIQTVLLFSTIYDYAILERQQLVLMKDIEDLKKVVIWGKYAVEKRIEQEDD